MTLTSTLASTTDDAADALRGVMKHYPTGITVITGMVNGAPLGLIVGTFSSVSLDPPLVSYMPMKTSRTFGLLRESGTFTVNVLAHDQEQLCRSIFSARGCMDDVSWTPSSNGNPIIDDAIVTIECTVQDIIDVGDHWFVLGAVDTAAHLRQASPLVFLQGTYGTIGNPTQENPA